MFDECDRFSFQTTCTSTKNRHRIVDKISNVQCINNFILHALYAFVCLSLLCLCCLCIYLFVKNHIISCKHCYWISFISVFIEFAYIQSHLNQININKLKWQSIQWWHSHLFVSAKIQCCHSNFSEFLLFFLRYKST